MKTLFKAVALITFFSVLTRAAGFIFRIYLSRTIGAEALGVYQVSLSVFFVLLTFVASGLPLIISRNTAKYTTLKDFKSEKQMMGGSLLFATITSILLCTFVVVFKDVFSLLFTDERSFQILLFLLPAVLLTGLFTVFRGWLWGKNNYFAVCFTEFIEQISRILICVVLLAGTFTILDGASAAAISLTISCVISTVIIIVWYFASGGRVSKPKYVYKDIIKPSSPITTVRIITSLVQPLIAIIIPLRLVAAGYTNSQAMSLFGVAIGMTLPLLFIPSTIIGSLSMALIPDLSSAVTKQDNTYIHNRVKTSLIFTMFFSALFVPLFMGAGEEIGLFFYDNALSGSLLSYSAWFMIPFGITSITASILNAVGLELKSMKNYIIGAILLLICVWFLPEYIGINALVWGMGLCMITSALLNIIMLRKKIGLSLGFSKAFWLMLVFIIPTAAITNFLTKLLLNFFNLFFTLFVSCSVGGICFVLLCVIFNLIDYQSIFVRFKKSKSKKRKFKTKINIRFPKLLFFKFKRKVKRPIKIYPN